MPAARLRHALVHGALAVLAPGIPALDSGVGPLAGLVAGIMMELGAFYAELERQWKKQLGLEVKQRLAIVPGQPQHGWKWYLADGERPAFWVSLNASILRPWCQDRAAPFYRYRGRRARDEAETIALCTEHIGSTL